MRVNKHKTDFREKRPILCRSSNSRRKSPPKPIVLYGFWSDFKSTLYSVKYNTKCKARPETRSRYFWLKCYLRTLEYQEIDANHCQKWVWNDSPSTNVVAIASLKEELVSNEEKSTAHLTLTANISKWQTRIAVQQ